MAWAIFQTSNLFPGVKYESVFQACQKIANGRLFILAAKIGQKSDIRKCTTAMWQIFLEEAMFCDWDAAGAGGLCSTCDYQSPSHPPSPNPSSPHGEACQERTERYWLPFPLVSSPTEKKKSRKSWQTELKLCRRNEKFDGGLVVGTALPSGESGL